MVKAPERAEKKEERDDIEHAARNRDGSSLPAASPLASSIAVLVSAAAGVSALVATALHRWRPSTGTPVAPITMVAYASTPEPGMRGAATPQFSPSPAPEAQGPSDTPVPTPSSGAAFSPLVGPQSALGEHLWHVAETVPGVLPHSVAVAVRALSEEATAFARSLRTVAPGESELYQRIGAVRRHDQACAVEDLLYCHVAFTFQQKGVVLLTPEYLADPVGHPTGAHPGPGTGTFSADAADVIEGRVPGILQMLSSHTNPSEGLVCKYHAAQAYAGGALFGYFLRQADKRFALAKSAGLVPPVLSFDETVTMLGELYSRVPPVAEEPEADLDAASPLSPDDAPRPRGRPVTLREHLETLQPEITMQMMRMTSLEAANVLRAHTRALFGDLDGLQQQLMGALQDRPGCCGGDMVARLQAAVRRREVDVVRLSAPDQRRLVLEAVTFGAFLRDIEAEVQARQLVPLLAPNAPRWGGGGPSPPDTGPDGGGDPGHGDGGNDGGGGGGGGPGPSGATPRPQGPSLTRT